MARPWTMLALFAVGCLDHARVEIEYDHAIDEARIPPGGDIFSAVSTGGDGTPFCMAYDLDESGATGSGGRGRGALVDVGWLVDDNGQRRPFGLCWKGTRGALQTQRRGPHGEGWELDFGDDTVDLRLWSGHGAVSLTDEGALRWYRGTARSVDSTPAVAEVVQDCTEIRDYRVLDGEGAVFAVGPGGLARVTRSGETSCNPDVTGDRIEIGDGIAWIRDGQRVTAVSPDGTVTWERRIDGLLHISGDTDLAVTVLDDTGTALRTLDGSTGVEVARIALPAGTRGAAVDGSRIVSWEDDRVVSWSWGSPPR